MQENSKAKNMHNEVGQTYNKPLSILLNNNCKLVENKDYERRTFVFFTSHQAV